MAGRRTEMNLEGFFFLIALLTPVHCIGEDLHLPFLSQENLLPPLLTYAQLQELQSTENILHEISKTQTIELQNVDEHQMQVIQQDEYLHQYGLYRAHIQGDGNCLFRSVSFGLYGTEDHHYALRELAVNHIQENLDDFRFYLYGENGLPMTDTETTRYLNNLRQLGTFAGQESILALSRVLNLNILVTIGGDSQNPVVNTLEHNFHNSGNIIHLVWTRAGGGHYESVIENPALKEHTAPTGSSQNTASVSDNNTGKSSYNWRSDAKTCKPFSLDVLEDIKSHKVQNQNTEHSYGREYVDKGDSSRSQTKCPRCNRSFYNKATMMRHQKLAHEKENGQKILCSISTCALKFHNVDTLVDHLRNFHGACIDVESLTFESIDLFEQFKEQESIKIHSRYVKQRKNKVNKDGSQSYTLVCHRDGVKRIHLKKGKSYLGKRKENIKGSCKIQKLCPSRMSVKVKSDGSVQVKYIKSHTHSLSFEESKFLPLPDSVKSEICTMLALKIPINTILDRIRENVGERNERDDLSKLKYYHLLDRKTIHNLKKTIVDSSVMRHSDDATSTFLKVNELRNEIYNPVLVYKQQNIDDPLTGLQKEDFMLAIMTKQQLAMFKKFASLILCMDSTHKTNVYSFKLITLLVLDEFRHGYPVAFCVSNRESEDVISVFLNSVKMKSPNTKVNILMTDDDNSGWNAAKKVFGGDLKHFLCHWHVHENWKKKIRQLIKDEELQAEIYTYLCACLQAQSENLFSSYVQELLRKLQESNQEFLHYFQNFYLSRKEIWAKCFRSGEFGNVHTNMFVESFHNQLKTIYFEGKRNRRIDVLVDTLLQIEKNLFMTRLRRLSYNLPSGENINNFDRHQRSLEIDDSCIFQISDFFFTVTSSDSTYDIKKLVDICSEKYCFNKCKTFPCIDLCKHLFSCSCLDYKNGHVCKHLHKIHAFANVNSHKDHPSNANTDFSSKQYASSRDTDSSTSTGTRDCTELKIQHIEQKLNTIAEQIKNNPSVQNHRLDNILSALDHIIAANEGSNQIHNSMKDFKKTEKISSNAKNLLQPRFRPTVKKPGRIPKPRLRKPTEEEMRNLLPNVSGSSQDSTVPVSLPGPSVAPYPPLRLVPPTTNTLPTQPAPQQSVFSVETGLGQPTWMRVPPSMLGRRIVTTINGKKQVIVFTREDQRNDPADKDGV